MFPRVLFLALLALGGGLLVAFAGRNENWPEETWLRVGFGETDVTPALGGKRPVYLAGFGTNRQAAGVHDPLKARAIVLNDGRRKVAVVSVDVIGLFHESVRRIRARLKGFQYVLVTSTHNHEGPDTLGLWGKSLFSNGVNPAYLAYLEYQVSLAVAQADQASQPVTARIGTVRAPDLLHDNREPYVKHDELVALQFRKLNSEEPAGVLVQWNCHPETLGNRNRQVSADFVGATVKHLRERYGAPVIYLTGTVGGLMTSLGVPVQDDSGVSLADGTFAKTEWYGRRVGERAEEAIEKARPLRLTPFSVRRRLVYLPLDNTFYQLARQVGVLERQAFTWGGNSSQPKPLERKAPKLCLETEIAWLRLGDLDVAAIPGEIYPELVLDKVQAPPDPGADFPDAPIEPAIYKQLPGPYRMIVGLANDEIGYIIPKRQWDEKPPYCYGRKEAQYGEINSVGPETAPILCQAFRDLVRQGR